MEEERIRNCQSALEDWKHSAICLSLLVSADRRGGQVCNQNCFNKLQLLLHSSTFLRVQDTVACNYSIAIKV